jgi:hypothetical protein
MPDSHKSGINERFIRMSLSHLELAQSGASRNIGPDRQAVVPPLRIPGTEYTPWPFHRLLASPHHASC